MKVQFWFLLIAFLALPSGVVAEPSTPTNDLIDLQIEMAEQSFAINPSNENRSELLGLYEQMVDRHCLAPEVKGDSCAAWTGKLTELYPESPVLVCATFGIKAEECAAAYEAQEVRPFVYVPRSPPGQSLGKIDEIGKSELEAKLNDSRVQQEVQTLMMSGSNLAREYQKSKTVENFDRITNLFEKAISLSCISTRSALAPPQGTSIKLKNRRAIDTGTAQRPADVAALKRETEVVRIRAISPLCRKTIDVALGFDPKLPFALCAEHGRYSPRCIQAIEDRVELRKRWEASSAPTSSSPVPSKKKQPPAKLESF